MFTTKTKNKHEAAPWEQFCKDEARRAAHEFLEKVRRLQTVDDSSMEVPESVFATKFSAHFMDEVMDLTGGGPNGLHSSAEFPRGKKTTANRSWWNIFRRKPSRDAVAGIQGNRNAYTRSFPPSVGGSAATVVLEAHVKMLDMGISSMALSWQACRLVLSSEQGNNQLEIYCPPKSNFPKMSLFCFLLKEVRSSTALELPDSVSSFVVKSDNHLEYVFDAGSEKEKENWVSTVRSHSSHLCHQHPAPNGHIANKPRSHSISGSEHSRLHKPHHALVSFQPHLDATRVAETQTVGRDSIRPTLKSFSASPSPCRSNSLHRLNQNSSNCSTPATPDRETTPSFFRCRPQRPSPNPRPRRTLSMYEHSSLPRPSPSVHVHSHSHSQTPPSPTPPSPSPPLPKRNQRSISSLSEINKTHTNATDTRMVWQNGSNPAIVTSSSSPNAVANTFSSNPGNLHTCSQNSSSSALHPVTLAAGAQPRTKNGRNASVSSLNTSPTPAPKLVRTQLSPSSSRKPSTTTSASPSGSANWTHDIEEEVRRARQRFPSCDGLSGMDIPCLDSAFLGDVRRKHDGSPGPPTGYYGNLSSPAASPSVLRRFSPTLDPNLEETDGERRGGTRDSEVIEVFPGKEQEESASGAVCMSPSPTQLHSKPRNLRFFSDTQVESIHYEPRTLRTPSPSSGGTSSTFEPHQPAEHNGIFIEIHNTQNFPPGMPSNTTHPYPSWAVTHQDAANLRDLVQYPWFHGMISRANATQLVLMDGEAGSGRYLVRQSESREGEFVLTFNYKGRAKHLRIVLDSSGCSVQHLFFNTVSNMLEYFKLNNIPLETCWNEDECRINDSIDRSASDSVRTITAIYHDDLLSSPRVPRRSHSLHIALTQAVMSTIHPPHGGSSVPSEHGASRRRRGSTSLPHSTQQSATSGVGWRQMFRSNRAGTLQRRHSEISDIHHAIDNNYTMRF